MKVFMYKVNRKKQLNENLINVPCLVHVYSQKFILQHLLPTYNLKERKIIDRKFPSDNRIII